MPHRFRALFNHTQDAVCMADATGRIAQANPAAVARFGLAADGEEARHLRDLFEDVAEWEAVRTEVEQGQVGRRTVRLLGADGATADAEMTCVGLRDAGGGLQIQAIIHAPAQNPAAEAMDALFDPDTGMPNRTAFLHHLSRALAASAVRPERGSPCCTWT